VSAAWVRKLARWKISIPTIMTLPQQITFARCGCVYAFLHQSHVLLSTGLHDTPSALNVEVVERISLCFVTQTRVDH
jgi:hypothetical protein